jgi:hypothetical protein
MNNLAIASYIGMHALQIQNVKRNVVKKASINELNNDKNNEQEKSSSQNNNQDNNSQNKHTEIDSLSSINNLPEPSPNENNFGSQID